MPLSTTTRLLPVPAARSPRFIRYQIAHVIAFRNRFLCIPAPKNRHNRIAKQHQFGMGNVKTFSCLQMNCMLNHKHPTASQCSQYGHHAREQLSPSSSCCPYSNFLQQPSQTGSKHVNAHASKSHASPKKMRAVLCASGCLHSVFDLLHLFGGVHVAVAALLGVHKSTGVLNENLQES